MQLGIIGLGRMGGNIARRLMRAGHECVVFDQAADAVKKLESDGAQGSGDLAGLVKQLAKPRAVWVMLPAGEITGHTIETLGGLLEDGDIVIDGGNSFFKDDITRAQALKAKGIHHVDAGTSGGVWGLERGYCLMIGGEKAVVDHLDPIFKTLAPGTGDVPPTPGRTGDDQRPTEGYIHCGPNGSGHFVKMVHNGIEYGLMQAYAEGFHVLQQAGIKDLPAEQRYDLNLPDIAEAWRRGSVVGSWLLDLTAQAFAENSDLSNYSGYVQDSGEGRWTIMAAIEEGVPATVLSAALYARFRSREEQSFPDKLLSAMRHGFGGHVELKPGA
ncbi:MAG TPA: decarboxylating 6-phosphogluconate dehydrogenase [Alphaproteobacteria bacterium]|jgi:6-phosphogluconate dehydrogenase|nr:decarboxylating 6-phosphogluconate dehydrogenase [Alphaproteobacteria bacterium]